MRDKALRSDATVKFLVDKITDLGCALPPDFFECQVCPPHRRGGFMPPSRDPSTGRFRPSKIAICEGANPEGQVGVNITLAHELIHAYDHCRAKIRWDNCAQHACTEVRAANLSGDCKFSREIDRGFYAFKGQQQRCVKRRALISVLANPSCSEVEGKAALDKVFAACYADTAPFEYAP